ncbi:hypothetical protein BC828DRAFT_402494 [Blastocladiella britannica]|nr:hypothetical protein BC828DRAFT_402494 [Blastocladiella britannica]
MAPFRRTLRWRDARHLLILALWAMHSLPMALAATSPSAGCFSMAGTAFCSAFTGAKLQPLATSAGLLFNSPASFDDYLTQSITPSSFTQVIHTAFGCNTAQSKLDTKSSTVQNFLSYSCALSAFQSQSCWDASTLAAAQQGKTGPVALCRSSCDTYVSSLQQLFAKNPQSCVGPSAKDLDSKFNSLKALCSTNAFFNATSNCVNAAQNEKSTCGAAPLDAICTSCSSFSDTDTCTALLASTKPLSSPALIGIVAGSAIAVVALIFMAFMYRRRRREHVEKVTYKPNGNGGLASSLSRGFASLGRGGYGHGSRQRNDGPTFNALSARAIPPAAPALPSSPRVNGHQWNSTPQFPKDDPASGAAAGGYMSFGEARRPSATGAPLRTAQMPRRPSANNNNNAIPGFSSPLPPPRRPSGGGGANGNGASGMQFFEEFVPLSPMPLILGTSPAADSALLSNSPGVISNPRPRGDSRATTRPTHLPPPLPTAMTGGGVNGISPASIGLLGSSYQSHIASPLRPMGESPLYTAAVAADPFASSGMPGKDMPYAMALPLAVEDEDDHVPKFTLPSTISRSAKYPPAAMMGSNNKRAHHRVTGVTALTCAPTEIDTAGSNSSGFGTVPRRQSSLVDTPASLAFRRQLLRSTRSESPPPPEIPASILAAQVEEYGDDENAPDILDEPKYYVCIRPYEALSSDEMSLAPGHMVLVQAVYSDGWAWGCNTSTDEAGMLPLVCLVPVAAEATAPERRGRR